MLSPDPGADETPDETALVVGLVASPGAATDLAGGLVDAISRQIAVRLPGGRWIVRLVSDRLVEAPADLTQLIGAARRRLLADGWNLAVCVTDLPLETARRPVVAHASVTHGVAVLSLPALGPVAVARRATEGVVRLVATLAGEGEDVPAEGAGGHRDRARITRRVRELGAAVRDDEHGIGMVAGIVTGNLRLLLGMVRANRPWRLAVRLSRALVAALATAVVALVTGDIWRLATAAGAVRLSLVTVGSVAAVVMTLVVGAGLWERMPAQRTARKQVILFNLATVATVLFGVLVLYLALFALNVLAALLLLPEGPVSAVTGEPVGLLDRVELAWLTTSLATVGGALGAGLETDEAVREAAYCYSPDAELTGTGPVEDRRSTTT